MCKANLVVCMLKISQPVIPDINKKRAINNSPQKSLCSTSVEDSVSFGSQSSAMQKKNDDSAIKLLLIIAGIAGGIYLLSKTFAKWDKEISQQSKGIEKEVSQSVKQAKEAANEIRKEKLRMLRTKLRKGLGQKQITVQKVSDAIGTESFGKINNVDTLKNTYEMLKLKKDTIEPQKHQQKIVDVLNQIIEVIEKREDEYVKECAKTGKIFKKGQNQDYRWAKKKLDFECNKLIEYMR